MLPKKKRLLSPQFLSVLKKGRSVSGAFLTLKYSDLPLGATSSKFSVVVPKAVEKGAVGRNALRRKVYAALETAGQPKNPISGAIFLKKEAKDLTFEAFTHEIHSLFERARLL